MSPSASPPPDTLLVESIRLDPGGPVNLPYHQARFDRGRADLFGGPPRIDLRELLEPLDRPPRGERYKVRVVYDREIREVTSRPYVIRDLKRIWLVEGDAIDYRYKYLDRTAFEELKGSAVPPERADSEEVLILKHGLVTDTTFSNVAFFDGREWVTPESFLLAGTRRAALIDAGRVRPVPLRGKDVSNYVEVSFINAMLDLGELTLPLGRSNCDRTPESGPRCIGGGSR